MKKNMLLKPISYSVLVLALFSLLLYLIAGNPEATAWSSFWSSFWSSLGVIIMGVLRTIQWIIAMTLALLACLAFLFALFFGAVALFSREVSAKMFHNLKTLLLSGLPSLTEQCCCNTSAQSSQEEATIKAAAEALAAKQECETMNAELNSIREHLHTTNHVLTDKIDQLTARIDSLEAMTTEMASKKQLDDISHKMQDAVSAMQSSVDQTTSLIQEISPDNILGDLPQRVQILEEQQSTAETSEPVDIAPLQNDINAMQSELTQVKAKADKALLLQAATDNAAAPVVQAVQEKAPKNTPEATSEEKEEEHRIFSYFDEPADKEKLVELVASTLGKDMSYKHVLSFLVKEFGPVKGKIISSHPSLSKDYIRQCRKTR